MAQQMVSYNAAGSYQRNSAAISADCIRTGKLTARSALKIHAFLKEQFVVIIDERDCLFREDIHNTELQEIYINFLRGLFKGIIAEMYVELPYITGILPIKKYGTQSALNHFDEYTMVSPAHLKSFPGFTEDEVRKLCKEYYLDFEEAERWYDGYIFEDGAHSYI